MPGYVRGLTGTDVFPLTLSRAFSEQQTYAISGNEYHDGSSQRAARVDRPRHSWRLAKRLTPTQLATLQAFWLAHVGTAFYFYNPKEASPANSYDATGAATTGRYLVRFASDWSQSVGIALSDVPVELIEVASVADVDDSSDELPFGSGAGAAPRSTGVWVGYATHGYFDEYSDENAFESVKVGTTQRYPLPYPTYAGAANPWGRSVITWTSGLRDYSVIYLDDFEPPPIGYDASRLEWVSASAIISYTAPSTTLASTVALAFRSSGWGWPYREPFGGVSDPCDRQTLVTMAGYRDDNANTIPAGVCLTRRMCAVLWHSLYTSDVDNPATMTIWGAYLAFYHNAVRINCGDVALQSVQGEYPLGVNGAHTWSADGGFTGGGAFTGGGTGLYAKGRKGSSFRYTIGRNIFAEYAATVRYKVILGFQEHEYSSVGQRVFSVTANGYAKLGAVDIYATVGADPYEETFEVEIASLPDGRLYLDFAASVGEALVNHIIVMPMVSTGVLG